MIQCFWYSRAPVFGFGGTSAAVFRAYLRRHLLIFSWRAGRGPYLIQRSVLHFVVIRTRGSSGSCSTAQSRAQMNAERPSLSRFCWVLTSASSALPDVVGHIEGSPAGGVEVHGLAGGLLGVLLGSGSGVVGIAGDAPAGVVVGVGAILGGVRDVLEACDGTGSRGCSDTAFSREEADKKRNSAERKARDARRAGRIPSESGPKRLRKSEIQRMLARSRATPRVHAPDEGRSEDA